MRRVRRKGANKEKVFGCDLLEHLNASSQEIPVVLRSCSEFVETHGIVDGIYRLSGVSSNIQKLRGEFESDGSPELNKDLYLQDIHCVSSLCKAYFRELPNPLLTYQLYDKFAEAVAIQLEEERLVKIRDVLKELPRPHYRTLEFLMRHLVRMASYSSETNMHARNLAIVWAPNLLRSKDIEASGFNGTAAFMEVRVQSIVVEFILTHVPQLFPEAGDSNERRKSLPSPSAACVPEEPFFKSQHVPNFGNISPGDGPLAIRPYHAIIEGTDKRKGSLKGRKWMSIFNIGGRFPDPRRRHKHSAKEKERQVLRPARSMDSLSTPPYPNEGCRRSAQRPPSNNIPIPTASPLVTSSPKPGLDVTVSTGALGGSEYAVTYRRGTGLVSGGTQGTYTALDPEGLGLTGNETLQSRSPGLSTKVGRRAAMHITGPTMVTVPLHITSNLALGVLQGGGSDRIIHRGRDKDGGDRVEGKEGGEIAERRESRVIEKKVEESRQVEEEEEEEEEINHREKVVDAEEPTVPDDGGEEGGAEKKEDEEELVTGGRGVSREQRVKSLSAANTDEDNEGDAFVNDYMDMKGMQTVDFQPEVTDHGDDGVFDSFNVLNSTEVEGDDLGLSGYVQDNFDFLDQMDCSAMDHMDCSVPCQVNEFSVEPPGHSDDEYEVMEQAQTSCHPAEVQTHLQPDPETRTRSQTELNPHRPLSLDINSRHTKSLSLPYMTSPVHRPEDSSSEDEVEEDDSDENYYSSDDNDSMFVKSLPPDFFLSNLPGFKPDTDEQDCCDHDGVPACPLQSCEERECQSQNHEFPACEESRAGDVEQVEVKDKVDEEKEITKTEEEDNVYQEGDQLKNKKQSKTTEEDCSVMEDTQSDKEQRIASEASTHCCTEFPLLSDDESSTMTYTTVEEEKEVVDNPYRDYVPCHAVSSVTQRESADVLLEESIDFSVEATEQPRICVKEDAIEKDSDEGDGWKVCKEIEDMCQEIGLEMKEGDWEVCEETTEEDIKPEEKTQGVGKAQDSAICGTSDDICDELDDEEQEQVEKKGARESVVREGDEMEDVKVAEEEEEEEEEEEQIEKVSGEEMVEDGDGGTNEAEVRIEVVEDSMETSEEKLTDTEMQQEFEEKETNLPNTSEQDEAIQRKHAMNDKTQRHDREEVVSKEKENNDDRAGEHNTKPSVDKQVKEVRSDKTELKEGRKFDESDSSQEGVGRKLVISKNPKVYQVKAVPVVPPKPQHCKITALTLRQQQQQRDRRDADRGRENMLRVPTEQDKVSAGEQGKDGDRDGERERRRDGDEGATSRNSPLSMCFDEAVAIATMRREKEKGCEKEKEKERQRDWGNEVQ